MLEGVDGRRGRAEFATDDLDPSDGDQTRVSLPHPEIFRALSVGTDLLLDDGRIRLKVEEVGEDFAESVVLTGGGLSDKLTVELSGKISDKAA